MKRKLSIVLAVILVLTLLLTSVAFADVGHKKVIYGAGWSMKVINWLDMSCYSESGCWCGPSSGVSIGQYYREAIDLDGDEEGVTTITEGFEWGTDETPLTDSGGDVTWYDNDPQGGSYAQIDYGVAHFGIRSAKIYRDGSNSVYAWYSLFQPEYIGFYMKKDGNAYAYFLNGDGTKRIIVRITSGEMLQYYDTAYRNVCTVSAYPWHLIEFRDINWSAHRYDIYVDGDLKANDVDMQTTGSSNGVMQFASAAGSGAFWVDGISYYVPVVEDFEWGTDGASLNTSGGEVTWTVSTPPIGNSAVEIDTAEKHWGTRSARFYYDGVYIGITASYPQDSPTWRKFYFKGEDSDASFCTITGDDTHIIYVRVRPNDSPSSYYAVDYYDGLSWKNVCTVNTPNSWHCLEFKNISWINHTYDILVDGARYKTGENRADMYEYYGYYSVYNGITAYEYYDFCCGGGSGDSTFWIDDILDTRVGYSNLPYDDAMYDSLHEYMETDIWGATDPTKYGPGFIDMTEEYGYDNFSYVYDGSVTSSDYDNIVNAIDHGWPVAIFAIGMLQGFSGVEEIWTDGDAEDWPCPVRHVIAIKGYTYQQSLWPVNTYDRRLICTDNYSDANNLMISWDELIAEIGGNLRIVIIKDS